jgi:hypothetical protein
MFEQSRGTDTSRYVAVTLDDCISEISIRHPNETRAVNNLISNAGSLRSRLSKYRDYVAPSHSMSYRPVSTRINWLRRPPRTSMFCAVCEFTPNENGISNTS